MEQEIQIQLFGAFRSLQSSPVFHFKTLLPISVRDLKIKLTEEFAKMPSPEIDATALLKVSALATEKQVLTDRDVLHSATIIALLPPVCGG